MVDETATPQIEPTPPPPPGQPPKPQPIPCAEAPSAADLDAVAEEQRIAEQTAQEPPADSA